MPTDTLASIRETFADTLCDLAKTDTGLFVVSMDLKSSLALDKFATRYKNRFIECGIAENNAAAVAAGLAAAGKTVFLSSYACFSPAINWAVIRQSICYQKLPVIIVGSHAGLATGELGATHQILEDIALMRSLPNMEVFAPADAPETEKIVRCLARSSKPSYLRLTRPATPVFTNSKNAFTIGKSQLLKQGTDATVIGYGPILSSVLEIKNLSLDIINCSSIKPLDTETILKSVKKTGKVMVIEDHQQNGGLGEAIASLILSSGLKAKFIHLAVNDQFGQSSRDLDKLYHHYGLSKDIIFDNLKQLLK